MVLSQLGPSQPHPERSGRIMRLAHPLRPFMIMSVAIYLGLTSKGSLVLMKISGNTLLRSRKECPKIAAGTSARL